MSPDPSSSPRDPQQAWFLVALAAVAVWLGLNVWGELSRITMFVSGLIVVGLLYKAIKK